MKVRILLLLTLCVWVVFARTFDWTSTAPAALTRFGAGMDSISHIHTVQHIHRTLNIAKLTQQQAVIAASEPTFDNIVQRQALLSIFEAAGGRQWRNNSGWISGDDNVCSWHGVTCVDGAVTELQLGSNNLNGIRLIGLAFR